MPTDHYLKVAVVAGCGMFLSTLDSGIINIAIPTLLHAFSASIDVAIWTVTLYTLALSCSILYFGRLADRVGRMRIYVLGLILFLLSSILCGLSSSMLWLIIFRGLQGLSASMMQATSFALITTRLSGRAQTQAFGILGMLLGLGPLLGPVIGGFLLSAYGWPWLFWINVPICLLGLWGCTRLSAIEEPLHDVPIAYANLLAIGVSMLCLLLALDLLSKMSVYTCWPVAIGLCALAGYAYLETRSQHPVIDFRLFTRLKFSAPMLCVFAFGGATAIAFILPPLYLAKLRGFSPWQIGLISLNAPLALVIASQLAARFIHRFGTLPVMLAGMFCMSVTLLVFTHLTSAWPLTWLVLLLLGYGFGAGLLQTPTYINLTNQFPKQRQAAITSLIRMLQNLSIALQAAGAAALMHSQQGLGLIVGIQHAWWLAAAVCLAALSLLSLNTYYCRGQLPL